MKSLNVLFALAIITPALVGGAFAYSGEKLAKTAKVTMEQATDIALKARPGKITDKEFGARKRGHWPALFLRCPQQGHHL